MVVLKTKANHTTSKRKLREKNLHNLTFSSVQFSRSVVSDSLRPHELQHARHPCPSPTPGVHSRLMSIEPVMPSSHRILCRPLLLLPPIPPSIRVFSPTPQFKSMNSSARSFLHSPTFTSIHDHWKNHSVD